jgi:[ribosomal protein S18]-alanine N-acetyltransferase
VTTIARKLTQATIDGARINWSPIVAITQKTTVAGGTDIEIDTRSHLRRLDAVRDMPQVLDLIEIGFKNELDPQGWKMLRQMRQLYQPNAFSRMVTNATLETTGFVWVEDDRIVGNLSLRHAQPRSSRGRLIGNVVVHPSYRHHGIGRALMERAIAAAKSDYSTWVGLEVRADNEDACRLYQHLGFHVVGTTEHLLRPKDLSQPQRTNPDSSWRRSRPQDASGWHHLATLAHTRDQRLVLEVRTDLYRFGGLDSWINRWLSRQREGAWVHSDDEGNIDLAVHVQSDRKYRFHVWEMLMHPAFDSHSADQLLAQAISETHQLAHWPVVTIVADQPDLVAALEAIGFRKHRTLQQMILEY